MSRTLSFRESCVYQTNKKNRSDNKKKRNLLIDKINEGINQNGLMNKREIIAGVYRRHIIYIDPNFSGYIKRRRVGVVENKQKERRYSLGGGESALD